MIKTSSLQFTLTPDDNKRLMMLCGRHNENLKMIEERLDIIIKNRGFNFVLQGRQTAIKIAKNLLEGLFAISKKQKTITTEEIHLMLHAENQLIDYPQKSDTKTNKQCRETTIHTKKSTIKPRSKNQALYIHHILNDDINFGIGPAGTGKTYLAVACAIHALEKDEVRRIILVRPAVEAGEKLGFLPGDLAQKVDPYLRPLYDALYEMLGFEMVNNLIEKSIIEIAPLAYMRGRTLNDSFIILDESQNTTIEQMKMFLTRIGFSSKAVITGDITQIDLHQGKQSGLLDVIEVLHGVDGISFTLFESKDVVRHPLVQSIIEAYDRSKNDHR